MLAVGARLPAARVSTEGREQVSLAELVAEGPVLLLFFLFAWSAT